MNKKNKRSQALYIEDMILAIEKVISYTKGFTFQRFEKDDVTREAVLLNMQIVGEAANHIDKEIQRKYSNVPWRDMINFRIIVAHIYFSIDPSEVWELISLHLPANLVDLKKILKEIIEQGK